MPKKGNKWKDLLPKFRTKTPRSVETNDAPANEPSQLASQNSIPVKAEKMPTPPKKTIEQKSNLEKFVDWSTNKYVVFAGLLFAFIGGIPGCLNLLDYSNRAPDLIYVISTPIVYDLDGDKGMYAQTELLLYGILLNNGERPLNPLTLDVKMEWNGESYTLERRLLTEGYKNLIIRGGKTIKLKDPVADDQQRLKKLVSREPYHGYLLFKLPFNSATFGEYEEQLRFKLICKDMDKTVYEYKFDFRGGQKIDEPVEMPKGGIQIQ